MKNYIKKITGLALVAVLVMGMTGCTHHAKIHVHTEGTDIVTVNPTCVTKGSKTYTCSGCGKVIVEEIPELYSSPVDVETGLAATSSSKYIYFGVFPKDVAYKDASGKLYAADKTTEITIDETDSITMGANTYYKGSDGEYYAKVMENTYDSDYNGTYTDTTTVLKSSDNSNRYFRVEPIKWKVLTTEYDIDGTSGTKTGALLLAEDILTSIPYYLWDCSTESRSVGTDTTIYPNNYKYSTIRAYLNGLDYYNDSNEAVADYKNTGFLQTAFTAAAQALINKTTIVNNGLSTTDDAQKLTRADGYKDYTCADTEDKIFLLSEQEVTTIAYGFASYSSYGTGNARIRKTTDYAKANHAYQSTTAGSGGWWWLRSPYYDYSNCARGIGDGGHATNSDRVSNAGAGLVPALSISF